MSISVPEVNATTILLGCVTFSLCWLMVRGSGLFSKKKLPPLVPSLPIIGSPYLWVKDPRRNLRHLWKKYGPLFRIHIGSKMVYMLNGNEEIRQALQEHPWTLGSAKPLPTFTTSRVVQGAHTDEGIKWSRRRAILASSYRSLGRDEPTMFRDMFTDEFKQMVKYIGEVYDRAASDSHWQPGGRGKFDGCLVDFPVFAIARMSAGVTYRLSYGGGKAPDTNVSRILDIIADNIHHYPSNAGPLSAVDRYTWCKKIAKLLGCNPEKYEYITKVILDFCDKQVNRRLNELSHDDESDKTDLTAYFREATTKKKSKDEMCGLTDETLYEGIGDVVRAGTSTATGILSWAVQYLAMCPDVQAEVYQEIKNFAEDNGTSDGAIFDIKRDSMPKCAAVVYEVMRVVSTLPYSKRRTLEDIELFGYTIPEGSTVVLSGDSANLDETVFPEPEEFRPWRFLRKDGSFSIEKNRDYLPFGVGKRRCPGEELGRNMLLSALATLVNNFVFAEHPKHPLPTEAAFGISIAPKPFKCILKKRF